MKKKNIHIFCSLEIMITSERNKNSINEEWGSEKKIETEIGAPRRKQNQLHSKSIMKRKKIGIRNYIFFVFYFFFLFLRTNVQS